MFRRMFRRMFHRLFHQADPDADDRTSYSRTTTTAKGGIDGIANEAHIDRRIVVGRSALAK